MERPDLDAFIARAADIAAAALDLDALAAAASPLAAPGGPAAALPPLGQRIAVARDEAFAFAYPHLLADWRAAGAEIRPFSPLADEPPRTPAPTPCSSPAAIPNCTAPASPPPPASAPAWRPPPRAAR
jgi:cobyrinic acid a,c-diamide synthase